MCTSVCVCAQLFKNSSFSSSFFPQHFELTGGDEFVSFKNPIFSVSPE